MKYLFPKPVGFIRDDHSVYVDIKNVSGKYRSILMDCGNNHTLTTKEFINIGTVLISHAHIDHIIGFDNILRMNLREDKKITFTGPAPISDIIMHKLRGYTWNLIYDSKFEVEVWDIYPRTIKKYLLKCKEAFAKKHFIESIKNTNPIINNDFFSCSIIRLDHDIPTIGYVLKEHDRVKIDKNKLHNYGLPKGQWLKNLKKKNFEQSDTITHNSKTFLLKNLYDDLIINEHGYKICYITDTILNNNLEKKIIKFAQGSDELYCEATFMHNEIDLARKYYHLTAKQTGELAKKAKVKKLYLIHFSLRYANPNQILNEAKRIFPQTFIPRFSGTCHITRKV